MLGNKDVMARNIQKYMDSKGITRYMLCDALDIKYTTLANWLQGNSYPRIDKIEMMANYFGVQKSDLVEEHDTHGEITLTSTEERLIMYYRMLSDMDKVRIEERIKTLLDK